MAVRHGGGGGAEAAVQGVRHICETCVPWMPGVCRTVVMQACHICETATFAATPGGGFGRVACRRALFCNTARRKKGCF